MFKMQTTFDPNHRLPLEIQDPHLIIIREKLKHSEISITLQSVVEVAIPYFMLYRPTALILTASLSVYHAWRYRYQTNRAIWTISSAAMIILFPNAGTLITHSCEFLYRLPHFIIKKKWDQRDIIHVVRQITYIASLVYATPAMIAISLVAQAAFELIRARNFYHQGNFDATVGLAGLAGIRLAFAGLHIGSLFQRNKPQFVLMDKQQEDGPQPHSQKLLCQASEKISLSSEPCNGVTRPERAAACVRTMFGTFWVKDANVSEKELLIYNTEFSRGSWMTLDQLQARRFNALRGSTSGT